ncbi:hypothetical protein AB664_38705 [Brucella anthropi]|uniref:Beta-lactamase-related domain-containing protein n=1 Tax=Brucella anthropi TaxID=529 RepID=A0A656Z4C9_BRUAN|nr:hypothetical protein AB664_38705 [Brucella anthropi]
MDLQRDHLLPEWEGDDRSKIKLADLLGMESGLKFDEDYGNVTDVTRMLFLENNMTEFAASLPLEAQPGTKFNYSSGTANILSKLYMESFDTRLKKHLPTRRKCSLNHWALQAPRWKQMRAAYSSALLIFMPMRATGYPSPAFCLIRVRSATSSS